MKIEEIKRILTEQSTIEFQLPDGQLVPRHFHVTEIGHIEKNFIDCGGTLRRETKASFQLWNANDYDHRLHPGKLIDIINLSQKALGLGNEEIEVEYQGDTIRKFGVEFDGNRFLLMPLHTDCLAKSHCGVPCTEHAEMQMVNEQETAGCCPPNSGCC